MSEYKMVPVEPTPEIVKEMRDAYRLGLDFDIVYKVGITAAPPAPVVGEPVAWRYRFEPCLPWHVVAFDDQIKEEFPDMEIEPLYAHPPATSTEREEAKRLVEQLSQLDKDYSDVLENSPPRCPDVADLYYLKGRLVAAASLLRRIAGGA